VKIINSKAEVKELLAPALQALQQGKEDTCVQVLHENILQKKIRFPQLEYAAKELYAHIPQEKLFTLTDKIINLDTVGSNVLAGIMLQLYLRIDPVVAVEKAGGYIIRGDEWYVCDIIGERVMGHALLTLPEVTIPVLKKLAQHEDKWIVRTVGVATHYAVKKGLKKQYAGDMFLLLLSLSHTTDFHTKKGIGWAAKTVAKFHPDIIEQHREQLETDASVKQWFKTKISIGLGRSFKYAHRYTG